MSRMCIWNVDPVELLIQCRFLEWYRSQIYYTLPDVRALTFIQSVVSRNMCDGLREACFGKYQLQSIRTKVHLGVSLFSNTCDP